MAGPNHPPSQQAASSRGGRKDEQGTVQAEAAAQQLQLTMHPKATQDSRCEPVIQVPAEVGGRYVVAVGECSLYGPAAFKAPICTPGAVSDLLTGCVHPIAVSGLTLGMVASCPPSAARGIAAPYPTHLIPDPTGPQGKKQPAPPTQPTSSC